MKPIGYYPMGLRESEGTRGSEWNSPRGNESSTLEGLQGKGIRHVSNPRSINEASIDSVLRPVRRKSVKVCQGSKHRAQSNGHFLSPLNPIKITKINTKVSQWAADHEGKLKESGFEDSQQTRNDFPPTADDSDISRQHLKLSDPSTAGREKSPGKKRVEKSEKIIPRLKKR